MDNQPFKIAGDVEPSQLPVGTVLEDLATRLTPNPARTVAGTLGVIRDALDKIDPVSVARELARINRRKAFGFDEGRITDEQWNSSDPEARLRLVDAARSLLEALVEATK